jgi:hypothetical protein
MNPHHDNTNVWHAGTWRVGSTTAHPLFITPAVSPKTTMARARMYDDPGVREVKAFDDWADAHRVATGEVIGDEVAGAYAAGFYGDLHQHLSEAHQDASHVLGEQADAIALLGLSAFLDSDLPARFGVTEADLFAVSLDVGAPVHDVHVPLTPGQQSRWAGRIAAAAGREGGLVYAEAPFGSAPAPGMALAGRLPGQAVGGLGTGVEFDPVESAGVVPCLAYAPTSEDPSGPAAGFRGYPVAARVVQALRRRCAGRNVASLVDVDSDPVPARIAVLTGVGEGAARSSLVQALTMVIGLPRLRTMVHGYGLDYARLQDVARACAALTIGQVLAIDERMALVDPSASVQAFRKTLHACIALLTQADATADDSGRQAERVVDGRHVFFAKNPDGSACLGLVGPALELEALHARVVGTARAIRRNNTAVFTGPTDIQQEMGTGRFEPGAPVPELTELVDERTIAQLAFDVLAGVRPETLVDVALADPGTGEVTPARVRLQCPDSSHWLAEQASVVVTVPVTTYAGIGDLPGHADDGMPVPAQVARRVAGDADIVYRLLTDPDTGRVLPSQAKRYRVSQAMRLTLAARWGWCTFPGCTRKASSCEPEHLVPFDHVDPEAGGATDFTNLHVMCKRHHELKTRGTSVPVRDAEDAIVWDLGHCGDAEGLSRVRVTPVDDPINAHQTGLLSAHHDRTPWKEYPVVRSVVQRAEPPGEELADPPPPF